MIPCQVVPFRTENLDIEEVCLELKKVLFPVIELEASILVADLQQRLYPQPCVAQFHQGKSCPAGFFTGHTARVHHNGQPYAIKHW